MPSRRTVLALALGVLAGGAQAAPIAAFDRRFRFDPARRPPANPAAAAGKRVALLLADDFNAVEAFYPALRLREAGVAVTVVGARAGVDYVGRGRYPLRAQLSAVDARGFDFDAVLVPGGEAPARLREDPDMRRLVREAHADGRIVAAVCHGPLLLARAGLLEGRRITAWPDLEAELRAAGARWDGDAVVVRDGALLTAQDPWTIDAFTFALIAMLGER